MTLVYNVARVEKNIGLIGHEMRYQESFLSVAEKVTIFTKVVTK
jgi:hypothetical protein